MLTLTEASLISTSMQGMLYGLSLFMFFLTFWILVRNGKARKHYNRTMLVATVALLVLSTMEWVVDVVRLVKGVVSVGPASSGGIEGYFADASQVSWTLKGILYSCQTLVLDAVVIYRAYVVWQNVYVVIVPILGWLGLLTTSIGTVVTLNLATKSDTVASSLFATATGRWAVAIYGTTLGTNLIATALLAYRIWQVNLISEDYLPSEPRSGLRMILRVIIESGAVYSMTIIIALVLFAIGSPGVYVIVDMNSPIICIVFNMIIVRVGFATDKRISDMEGSTRFRPAGLKISQRNDTVMRSSQVKPDAFDVSGERNPVSIELMHYVEDHVNAVSREIVKSTKQI